MDLSILKIVDGTFRNTVTHFKKEFIEETESRLLLIEIPSGDSSLMTRCLEQLCVRPDLNVKELMPLREGVHDMMQCDVRQHFAERYWLQEHPGRRSS